MKVFRNIFIGFLVLALLAGGSLYFVANNARAMSWLAQKALGYALKSGEVRKFSIGALDYGFPSSWECKDIRSSIIINGKMVEVAAAAVMIKDAGNLFFRVRSLWLAARGVELSFDRVKIGGVAGAVLISRTVEGVVYRGDISLATVAQEKFYVSGIKSVVTGDTRSAVFHNIAADIYGGRFLGDVQLVFPHSYDIDFVLQRVDSGQLERAFGGAFRELGGKLSGRARIQGVGARVDVLETSWDMPSGGEIGAALLSSIAVYLPASIEKKRLDALILSGGRLAVEVFSFTIRNDKPDHLSGEIGLKSRAANLHLNVAHEVNVDARIDSLWRAWQAVFK